MSRSIAVANGTADSASQPRTRRTGCGLARATRSSSADLLSVRQAAFLHDCQPARPPTGPLVRLGPIRVHRWPVRLGDAELAVVRWSSVDRALVGFDAIELSHRMSPVAADFVQHALFATVRRAGLTPDLAVPWLENRAVYKMRV
jgi:hypothetical protein